MARKKKSDNETVIVVATLLVVGGILLFKKKNPPIPVTPLVASTLPVPQQPTNLLTSIATAASNLVKSLSPGSGNTSQSQPALTASEDNNLDFDDSSIQNPDIFNSFMSQV